MKRILLFVPVLLVFSCNNSTKSHPKPFSADMLATQLFSIDPARDTSLQTLHGSIIRIPADAFNTNSEVDIIIKEAFTPAEILAAGLTTESDGRPLRSGGMIYINATAEGDSVTLNKPLQVSIPNSTYDSAMQVFKGEETDSAGINWVDPQPTDTTPQSKKWDNGKTLFRSKCASCHHIFAPLTGPALGGVEDRWRDRSKLYEWIWNSERLVARGYPKAVETSKYSAGAMVPFEGALTKVEIDDILFYISNEYNSPTARLEEQRYADSMRSVVAVTDTSLLEDLFAGAFNTPCGLDTIYRRIPKAEETFLDMPGEIVKDTIKREIDGTIPEKAEDIDDGFRNGFGDFNPTSGMYDFEVNTLGWYNIDAFVIGYDGTVSAKLIVMLKNLPDDAPLHVYLFCPQDKTLSVGGRGIDGRYYFDKIDGGIPLFLNQRGIIIAFGSYKDKMYYGSTEFRIQREQLITVIAKETTEEQMREELQLQQIDGINFGIEKKEMKVVERICDSIYTKPDSLRRI
jgi:mono/diheme cytochrome c family protein